MSKTLDATDSGNLLDVYKAGKEWGKPKRSKKKTHTFLFIAILLLFFLISTIIFIFTRAGAMNAETSGPRFESMLDN